MKTTWNHALAALGIGCVRVFPFLVVACILIIPAYKSLWIGYLPVLVGMAGGWGVIRYRGALEEHLTGWSPGRVRLLLYGLPVLVQLALILVFRSVPTFDGLFVYRHAEVLVATGAMDPMTYYPPAQTWWYAGWFYLLGPSNLVAQLSQIPLSVGVVWCTHRLAEHLGLAAGPRRLAALLVAWYPSFLVYGLTTPYYHFLYTLMTVGMVLVMMMTVHAQTRAATWYTLAGLTAGLGALTKAVQLIAPLQIATWMLMRALSDSPRRAPWRSWAVGLILFLIGMIVAVGPWAWRNYQVFHAWVPVCTSGGLVLYSANNPLSNGLYSPLPDDVALSTPAEMLAHTRWCSEQAKSFMMEQPVDFLRLAARKFLHTWGVEATFTELINWRGENRSWIKPAFSAVTMSGWSLVACMWLMASGRRFASRTSPDAFEWMTGVLILSNAVVYLVFEGGDRHHLPFVPLIVLLMLAPGTARSLTSQADATAGISGRVDGARSAPPPH